MIPKDFPRPNQARRHESPSGARGRGFGAGSVVTPTRTNSTASAAALAESIGLTPNQAATGIALMRSGRVDLINKVIAGDMTVTAALTAAKRSPVSA